MINIRNECFETNSSSQHALIYKHKRYSSELETNNGSLIIHVGDYTPEHHTELWSQKEKLGYIFTYIILQECMENYPEEAITTILNEDIERFKCLLDYTGCSSLCIVKDENINMASIHNAEFAENIYQNKEYASEYFLEFVFNPNIGIDLSYD